METWLSLPSWAWALIGLAIAFAVISSIVGAFVILLRRKHKKDFLPLRNSTSNSTNRNTGVIFGVNSPPSSLGSGAVDVDDNFSLLPAESMSANAMDVAAAAAMDLDVAALIRLRDAWRSES